jgi:dihydroorotate dehydrogenase (NAD+) catalytic subunit
MASLSATVGKLKLANPTILAAGILGMTAEQMLEALKGGAAAVVTKSIGLRAAEGHPNPTMVDTEVGYLNCMGLPNPGIDDFKPEVEGVAKHDGIVIGSIYAKDAKGFAALARKMESYGASAVELNLSCPHAAGLGAEIGSSPTRVENITRAVKKAVDIPVFPKLTPNVQKIAELALAAEKGRADGIVAINTLKAMAILPEAARPVLSNAYGGYSGPGIKPVGVRCVYEIAGEVDIPIIGVGGISTGRDAVEYIMAGASAVQIGSAVAAHGPGVFAKVCTEIDAFMDANGYKKISDMVGAARGGR